MSDGERDVILIGPLSPLTSRTVPEKPLQYSAPDIRTQNEAVNVRLDPLTPGPITRLRRPSSKGGGKQPLSTP